MIDTKISIFESAKKIYSNKTITIRDALEDIKNGKYKKEVEQIRKGDKELKEQLPMIAFHGLFNGVRKKDSLISFSGLIIIDIDDITDKADDIKEDIMDDTSVFAAMVSPSGNGIKVLYYIDKDIITVSNYRQIEKKLASTFSLYGKVDFLSITDCLIATYDKDIYINEEAEPSVIYLPPVEEKQNELEELDEDKELFDDAEEFYDIVLFNQISEKTTSNFHFIQVSMLELAKFGFTHPKYDLSFVVDRAEQCFHKSSKNNQRFNEAAVMAEKNPQIKYPYKLTNEEEDYSVDEAYKEVMEENEEELTEDGFINYEGNSFLESVIATAQEGDRVGDEISLTNFNDIFRFKGSGILTVTGIPGHGKTEFVDQCIVDLARLHDHYTIICGFEQSPQEHVIKLMRKMIGLNITQADYIKDNSNKKEFKDNFDFITSHIKHIDTTHIGGDINNILEISIKKISEMRKNGKNVRYMVLDPFNMLSLKGNFNGHEKIEEILRKITIFSHRMNVLVILVAHPFKMKKDEKTGQYEVPDFYSVKGSSAFFEMSYHGLVVYRTGYQDGAVVKIQVLKVKQNNLGKTGEVALMRYHKPSGRYIPVDEEDNLLKGDYNEKNWLNKIIKK